MSTALAIAAVTATLKNLLVAGLAADLPNADSFTTKPPDIARNGNTGDQAIANGAVAIDKYRRWIGDGHGPGIIPGCGGEIIPNRT